MNSEKEKVGIDQANLSSEDASQTSNIQPCDQSYGEESVEESGEEKVSQLTPALETLDPCATPFEDASQTSDPQPCERPYIEEVDAEPTSQEPDGLDELAYDVPNEPAEPVVEAQPSAEDVIPPEMPPVNPPAAISTGILLRPLHLLLALLGAVVLVTGGVFFGIWINQNILHDPDIDPGASDYGNLYEDQENTDPGNIAAPGYADVTLPADTKSVQMVLINPKGNPCYFRFILELEDSGEEIYRSGLIPPGMAVTDLTLTHPLEAGEYRLRIRIETQSLQDKTPMNGIEMAVKLTVVKQ